MRLPQPLDSPHLLSLIERTRDYLVCHEKWSIYFGFILITKAAFFFKKKDPQTANKQKERELTQTRLYINDVHQQEELVALKYSITDPVTVGIC